MVTSSEVIAKRGAPVEAFRFGDLTLDARAYELRRRGEPVRLEPIPMELLILLVERPGELVTRRQITERIWGADYVGDTDNGINVAVRKLRQALGDDTDQPAFIQTVTGRGYRFVAPISSRVEGSPEPGAPREPAALVAIAAEPAATAAPGAPRRRLLLSGLLVLGLLGAYLAWTFGRFAPERTSGRVMLAVLPFENLTGDPTQEYLSDGVTEELISRLGGLDPQRLGVIARSSVMRFKRSSRSLASVARELGVDYLLEGSVRRDGNRARVTAQLVDGEDETCLWAESFDRDLSSILAVQTEIAEAVADQARLSLAPRRRSRPGVLPMTMSAQTSEAWDLALQARYHWNQRTPQGLLRAAELYEQATAKDPGYAPAHAGLAATWALSSGYLVVPQEEFMPQAREAALQAIALDEGLADAHSALALVLQHYDLDWLGAERQFRRAVELGPNDATAHHWLAEHLGYRARFDEAFAEIEMAEQLDPLSRIIAADHAALLYFAGQLDRSIERFEAVLEKEPMLSRAYMVTYAYALSGRLEKAFESVERWRRVDDSPWILAQLAWVQGRAGRREDARRTLTRLEPVVRDQGLDLSLLVVAELGAGDDDRAITLLEEARRQRSPSLVALAVDPIYDPLRENPRFERLLRSLGLAATESP